MRASIVLPVQHPSTLSPFEPGKMDKSLQVIADLGYEGVELGITDPTKLDIDKVKNRLKTCGLKLSAITTGQAYSVEGISFTEREKSDREKAIQRIKNQIDFAAEFGKIPVIIGLIRGKGGDEKAASWLRNSLFKCVEYAEIKDIQLALEPINRYETSLINTVSEGLDLITSLDSDNLGILFDTFHANIEEPSIPKAIAKIDKALLYVHIADSNRWPPGFGHIDFKGVRSSLKKIGYHGFCSVECLPKPSPKECREAGVNYLRAW